MLLSEIIDFLTCEVFAADEAASDVVIEYGCASDLMSDVLAFSRTGAVLLTGLVNVQTIQTAFVAEVRAIVFVRGKKPDQGVIALAKEKKIPLVGTPYSMYESCGILYMKGLRSTMEYAPTMNSRGQTGKNG
ncbi:MAG: DRTGG domain-containing protein [Bacteroidota bacterium]|jgi:predicted transcriptional regulator